MVEDTPGSFDKSSAVLLSVHIIYTDIMESMTGSNAQSPTGWHVRPSNASPLVGEVSGEWTAVVEEPRDFVGLIDAAGGISYEEYERNDPYDIVDDGGEALLFLLVGEGLRHIGACGSVQPVASYGLSNGFTRIEERVAVW